MTCQMDGEMLESYRALSGGGVRSSHIGLYSSESRFGYYECFTFADGVPGLIRKSYSGTRVSEEFSLSFYSGEARAWALSPQAMGRSCCVPWTKATGIPYVVHVVGEIGGDFSQFWRAQK